MYYDKYECISIYMYRYLKVNFFFNFISLKEKNNWYLKILKCFVLGKR